MTSSPKSRTSTSPINGPNTEISESSDEENTTLFAVPETEQMQGWLYKEKRTRSIIGLTNRQPSKRWFKVMRRKPCILDYMLGESISPKRRSWPSVALFEKVAEESPQLTLCYYNNTRSALPKDDILLRDVTRLSGQLGKDSRSFEIETPKKKLSLQAESSQACQDWITRLRSLSSTAKYEADAQAVEYLENLAERKHARENEEEHIDKKSCPASLEDVKEGDTLQLRRQKEDSFKRRKQRKSLSLSPRAAGRASSGVIFPIDKIELGMRSIDDDEWSDT